VGHGGPWPNIWLDVAAVQLVQSKLNQRVLSVNVNIRDVVHGCEKGKKQRLCCSAANSRNIVGFIFHRCIGYELRYFVLLLSKCLQKLQQLKRDLC